MLWPEPFLRALNRKTCPGPIFLFLYIFFWEKKINYAIVYTPGCAWRRKISVLKCPECKLGLFFCFWISPLRYVLVTLIAFPWNVIPHIWSKADMARGVGGSLYLHMFLLLGKVVVPSSPQWQSPPNAFSSLDCSQFRNHPPNKLESHRFSRSESVDFIIFLLIRRLLFENRLLLRKQWDSKRREVYVLGLDWNLTVRDRHSLQVQDVKEYSVIQLSPFC